MAEADVPNAPNAPDAPDAPDAPGAPGASKGLPYLLQVMMSAPFTLRGQNNRLDALRPALINAALAGDYQAVEEMLGEMKRLGITANGPFLSDAIYQAAGSLESGAARALGLLLDAVCEVEGITSGSIIAQDALLYACGEGSSDSMELILGRFFWGVDPAKLLPSLLEVRGRDGLVQSLLEARGRDGLAFEDKWWLFASMMFRTGDVRKENLESMGEKLTAENLETIMKKREPPEILFMVELFNIPREKVCGALADVRYLVVMRSLYERYNIGAIDIYRFGAFKFICWHADLSVAQFVFSEAKKEIEIACANPESKGAKWLAETFGPGDPKFYCYKWVDPHTVIRGLVGTLRRFEKIKCLSWILSCFPPQNMTISSALELGPAAVLASITME